MKEQLQENWRGEMSAPECVVSGGAAGSFECHMCACTTRPRRMRVLFWSSGTLSLVTAEFVLRMMGFGQGAIYVADPDYEYMHAPNQRLRPFGNVLETNEFGMRSKPIREGSVVEALVLGDSLINGGNPTPQDALATSLLETRLQKQHGPNTRVLNISAGSWGPDNAAAFLTKHGLFGAKAIIAVFSSHDLGDIMTHDAIVGLHPAFPHARRALVVVDTWSRYVWPRFEAALHPRGRSDLGIDKFDGQVNPGWLQLKKLTERAGVAFVVVLHRTINEFVSGQPNAQGRMLEDYLRKNDIPFEHESGFHMDDYRDEIHLSSKGQADLARVLETLLSRMGESSHKNERGAANGRP
ncbi:MAG: hypothetical protein ACM3ZE_03425 [Myxococcales bacterium]